MKKVFMNYKIVGFVALLAMGLSLNSCGKVKGCMTAADDNYDATATEDDGSCDEAATLSKFLGNNNTAATYSVSEVCGSTNSTFDIVVSESSSADYTLLISNFADVFNASVIATVSQDDITIADQEPDGDNYTVSGNGTINGNTLTISYTVVNNLGVSTTCNATATKQ
jgi:hypothetical protein